MVSGSDDHDGNLFRRFGHSVLNIIDGPVTWFRETVVLPNRKESAWYHQKLRRVPTIDQCCTDDPICKFEANQQFRRDKAVDSEILHILRLRYEDCTTYENPDHKVKCDPLWQQYQEAVTNWFIKYGDLGGYGDAEKALMKQKHRMIWERRHGPVGSKAKGQEGQPC